METRLSARQAHDVLFTVCDGAPPIHFQGLVLSSSVRVEGGQLHISSCAFGQALGSSRRLTSGSPLRALTLSAGEAIIEHTIFSNLTGGAIALERAGSLHVSDNTFYNNRAESGGAMIVSGGSAVLTRCVFENNRAAVVGGGLRITGGHVELRNQTLLRGNEASEGRSVSMSDITSALVEYSLPVPLGHYVIVPQGGTRVFLNSISSLIDDDFPFSCPASVFGNSYDAREQSGPWCSGVCPAGFACSAGTIVPEVCPQGRYCPTSSANGEVCDAGSWSNRTGLASASECSVCPRGTLSRGIQTSPVLAALP